ncbi:UbiA prenyltransferase family protein [Halomicronema hongdechloris]|uniref:hypothetical protein n=1 Tax=Halomicronema hongdechloris TaxID=1209493 RepID=UPI00211ADA16|nr:hypothetical protein [Halomicronema hongdechloris]
MGTHRGIAISSPNRATLCASTTVSRGDLGLPRRFPPFLHFYAHYRPQSPRLHPFQTPWCWLYALWKFSRPHTIIGTSFSVLGLFAIAAATIPAPAIAWGELAWAWLACLGGNLYIVGLNQIQDIEIDRINKPPPPPGIRGIFPPRWLVAGRRSCDRGPGA